MCFQSELLSKELIRKGELMKKSNNAVLKFIYEDMRSNPSRIATEIGESSQRVWNWLKKDPDQIHLGFYKNLGRIAGMSWKEVIDQIEEYKQEVLTKNDEKYVEYLEGQSIANLGIVQSVDKVEIFFDLPSNELRIGFFLDRGSTDSLKKQVEIKLNSLLVINQDSIENSQFKKWKQDLETATKNFKHFEE